jgi:DNA-binding response OmpR family regulator
MKKSHGETIHLRSISAQLTDRRDVCDNEIEMAKKILVIDDESKIVDLCNDYLRAAGFEVIAAYDGPRGLAAAISERPDLIVLDLMLPGMDGLDVCRELRRVEIARSENSTPIIMLTARAEETDKLIGLELGADDYLTKPFSPRELVVRVRTVLRRASGGQPAELIRAGEMTLDRGRYLAILPGHEVALTPTEFEILATLASQPGRIFSRAQLLTAVRGVSFESYERAIDSHIRNLRRKIEPAESEPRYILTVHGVGYKFEA